MSMKQRQASETHVPSAGNIRAFAQRHSLTGSALAKLLYLSGSRAARKYTESKNPHRMSRGLWFVLHAQQLLPASTIAEIEAAMKESMRLTAPPREK